MSYWIGNDRNETLKQTDGKVIEHHTEISAVYDELRSNTFMVANSSSCWLSCCRFVMRFVQGIDSSNRVNLRRLNFQSANIRERNRGRERERGKEKNISLIATLVQTSSWQHFEINIVILNYGHPICLRIFTSMKGWMSPRLERTIHTSRQWPSAIKTRIAHLTNYTPKKHKLNNKQLVVDLQQTPWEAETIEMPSSSSKILRDVKHTAHSQHFTSRQRIIQF